MMRALKLIVLMGLLVAMTAPAWAFWPGDYGGPVKFKFVNYDIGTLYDVDLSDLTGTDLLLGKKFGRADPNSDPDATPPYTDAEAIGVLDGLAQYNAPSLLAGEDTWGIFYLTDILGWDDVALDYNISLFNWQTASYEITGMFWGEADTYLHAYEDVQGDHSQDIRGVGLEMAIFQDYAKNFDPVDPLNDGVTLGPAARSGMASYPTATDGSLLWTVTSVPGHLQASQEEFFTLIQPEEPFAPLPAAISADGGFHGELGPIDMGAGLVEGPGNGTSLIDFEDGDPTDFGDYDLAFNFTGELGSNGWLILSDDPVYATATPELPSGALLLLGMFPVGLAWLRRRKED